MPMVSGKGPDSKGRFEDTRYIFTASVYDDSFGFFGVYVTCDSPEKMLAEDFFQCIYAIFPGTFSFAEESGGDNAIIYARIADY